MADVDRRAFWPRFEAAAPWLVRFGFAAATFVLVGFAPWLLGRRRSFVALDAAGRDDVLRRVDRLPGGAELLQVVKIVACFAYFDDPRVQATVRGAPSP